MSASEAEPPAASQECGLEQNDDTHEPLGYQNYLCDVNIEYNPGGGRWDHGSSRHCFKLKYLPYMVANNNISGNRRRSDENVDSFLTESNGSSYSLGDDTQIPRVEPLDVSKTTCAFLGNSDLVPNVHKPEYRRVVLELISAKLAQSTTYLLPSKRTLTKPSRSSDQLSDESPGRNPTIVTSPSRDSRMSDGQTNNNRNHNQNDSNLSVTQNNIHKTSHLDPSSPSQSSKRFVNYTLLIKTAPGLDSRPAVIERRFSDFLNLYQRLKADRDYFAQILNQYVTFPKKVFMGNFSLNNIADRSVEFLRLLKLCMTNEDFLWSIPFISFLLDKEIKEAHKLVTCADPDDVQTIVETVYFILQKLYLNVMAPVSHTMAIGSANGLKHVSSQDSCLYQDTTTHRRPLLANKSSSEETVSGDPVSPSTQPDSSPNLSVCGISEDSDSLSPIKCIGGAGGGGAMIALNQRILVTFCMLFLTYSRGENVQEFKLAFKGFSQLLSSQEYMNSIAITRHQSTLKACLLFLMNLNHVDFIDDTQRLWLKRKLEDFDGFVANINGDPIGSNNAARETSHRLGYNQTDTGSITSQRSRRENGFTNGSDRSRVVKGDLVSLLKDRDFCLFQDTR